jgi:hypothetical protein
MTGRPSTERWPTAKNVHSVSRTRLVYALNKSGNRSVAAPAGPQRSTMVERQGATAGGGSRAGAPPRPPARPPALQSPPKCSKGARWTGPPWRSTMVERCGPAGGSTTQPFFWVFGVKQIQPFLTEDNLLILTRTHGTLVRSGAERSGAERSGAERSGAERSGAERSHRLACVKQLDSVHPESHEGPPTEAPHHYAP